MTATEEAAPMATWLDSLAKQPSLAPGDARALARAAQIVRQQALLIDQLRGQLQNA